MKKLTVFACLLAMLISLKAWGAASTPDGLRRCLRPGDHRRARNHRRYRGSHNGGHRGSHGSRRPRAPGRYDRPHRHRHGEAI